MATAARHAGAASSAPTRETDARAEAATYAYRAPHTRKRAEHRSRLTRAFVIFVGCLTLLAVGRVALSFAVVQKTLQTDAIVREERRISALNDEREGDIAKLASPVRIRHLAETQLGLVDAGHVSYPEPLLPKTASEPASAR